MKRCWLPMHVMLATFALLTCPVPGDEVPVRHPNIVVILADDLGYGDLSCYGATKVKTPNIDRLAETGMRFTDAHSPHSVCTPTRYGLLTGRYAWRTWVGTRCVWSNDPMLVETDRLTLPSLLKAAGYRTACIGKWHLGFGGPATEGWDDRRGPDYNKPLKPGPLEIGFDYFFGIPHVGQFPHVYIENHHVQGLQESSPLEIVLDERETDRTTWLNGHTITPRHTFTGGEGTTYEEEELAVRLTEVAVDWINKQDQEPFFLYFAQRNVHSPLKPHPRFQGTSEIGVYGDFVNELDWSIGELLDVLDRRGFAENTLVVFSSDNGAVQMGHRPAHIVDYSGHRSNGPLRGQKTEDYEGGHRIPLLVRWPGHVEAGSRSDQLVALTDLLATTAELIGERLPEGAGEDSFSFLSALTQSKPDRPIRTGIVHDSNEGLFAVREGDWKLILGQGGGGIGWSSQVRDPAAQAGQLFNLADDIAETDNRYDEHPEIVSRLTQRLQQERTRVDSTE